MLTHHTISTPCDAKERCCHLMPRDPTHSGTCSDPCSIYAQCILSEDYDRKPYDYEQWYSHLTNEEANFIAISLASDNVAICEEIQERNDHCKGCWFFHLVCNSDFVENSN
jgi:hypothetical protein